MPDIVEGKASEREKRNEKFRAKSKTGNAGHTTERATNSEGHNPTNGAANSEHCSADAKSASSDNVTKHSPSAGSHRFARPRAGPAHGLPASACDAPDPGLAMRRFVNQVDVDITMLLAALWDSEKHLSVGLPS